MDPSQRNKSKIQAMGMKFLRSTEVKTRRDRIKNDFFRKGGIQNLRVRREMITNPWPYEKTQ
jgi:ABC-type phosphonate transport system ATPase subunit